VRSWANVNKAQPLGFIGFKAGMTHIQITDNRAKSLTKGEKIILPTTIIDCPPMVIFGAAFYKKSARGMRKFTSFLNEKISKELSKKISLPKKVKEGKGKKTINDITEFDDVRLLVHSQPKLASTGAKKPKLIEIALGGNNDEKLNYVKENMGKEISLAQVFSAGSLVDVHGITKGKGFQGTVKRYGVPIRQHKSEKTKRGIGNLGAWTPKRVDYRVPQPGKMGFHLRTEYNKQIIKVGDDGSEVTARGGITKYGVVKNPYALLKGSVSGARKSAVLLTQAIRPKDKIFKEAPEVSYISLRT